MDKDEARQILLSVHDRFTRVGMPYFLIMGTALGAYRDRGFTPAEKDIDLGILYEVFAERHEEIVRELSDLGMKCRVINRPLSRPRVIVAKWKSVKIDICSYIRWKDKRFCPNSDPNTAPYSIVHEARQLERFEPIHLFGRVFWVSSPIEEYLTLEYGDDWRTPQEDHKSRTRVYKFLEKKGVRDDYLEAYDEHLRKAISEGVG